MARGVCVWRGQRPIWQHKSGAPEFTGYSKDHNNGTPPLDFRTYQILPHTNSYFHCLHSYVDLLL